MILQKLEELLDSAKGNHAAVIAKIDENRYNYEADTERGTIQGVVGGTPFTKFRMKDIKRSIESSIPDLTSPFINTDKIIDSNDDEMTDLINYQFNKGTKNKIELLETIARDIQIEGTVFTKVGFNGRIPTIENIQAQELILDPSARSMSDLNFAIQRRKVSIQSILDNSEWYGQQTMESLASIEATSATEFDDDRYANDGIDTSYNFEDRPNQLVETFEYYGTLDIGNGLEPTLAIWADGTLLRATESPYPAKWNGIPFEKAVYQRRSYNIYGEGLPELILDYQNIRDALMSDVVSNAKSATVGQTFIQKGGMDQMNFRRMVNGEKNIYMNKPPQEVLHQGTFNPIPADVFALMEGMKVEQEELSGIGRMNAGVDSRALNSGTTATAVNIANDNSQKRILQVTRHISEMLERIFYKWVDFNYMMNGVQPQQIDIEIKAGTSGIRQQKLQNIQVMSQALTGTGRQVPNSLLIEMANLLEMPEVAQEIEMEAQQGPSQEQQMAMQLEMQEKQATIAKDNAAAMKSQAEAVETAVETEMMSYGLN